MSIDNSTTAARPPDGGRAPDGGPDPIAPADGRAPGPQATDTYISSMSGTLRTDASFPHAADPATQAGDAARTPGATADHLSATGNASNAELLAEVKKGSNTDLNELLQGAKSDVSSAKLAVDRAETAVGKTEAAEARAQVENVKAGTTHDDSKIKAAEGNLRDARVATSIAKGALQIESAKLAAGNAKVAEANALIGRATAEATPANSKLGLNKVHADLVRSAEGRLQEARRQVKETRATYEKAVQEQTARKLNAQDPAREVNKLDKSLRNDGLGPWPYPLQGEPVHRDDRHRY